MTKAFWIAMATAMFGAAFPHTAFAQSRDGVYRGTLVCGNLTFMRGGTRSAIELTLSGNEARYTRPVVMTQKGSVLGTETGTGKLDGEKLALTGVWSGDKLGFEASYAGTFVRRSGIKLTGTQTWTHDGKTTRSNCSGSVKRPPAFFRRKAG